MIKYNYIQIFNKKYLFIFLLVSLAGIGFYIYDMRRDAERDAEAKRKIRTEMILDNITARLDLYKKWTGKYPNDLESIKNEHLDLNYQIELLKSINGQGEIYYFIKNHGSEYFLLYVDHANQNNCGIRAIDSSKVLIDKL